MGTGVGGGMVIDRKYGKVIMASPANGDIISWMNRVVPVIAGKWLCGKIISGPSLQRFYSSIMKK